MKPKTLLTSIFMIFLIVMLPICFADELNLIYDANGNLIKGDGKFREYNSLNQLTKIYNGSDSSGLLLEEYIYHPTEERILVKNVSNSAGLVETVYYIDENFVRVAYPNGTNLDYTYVKHEGQIIAQEEGGTKYYTHTDHLGSTSVITNESGGVIENTTYSPYGGITTGGTTSRFDYEGKEYDSVVGDTDFNFRKYIPPFFTQPDTLIQNVYDPQSLNRYSFERGNPYKYKDEDGHVIIAALAVIGIIALVSGGTELATQLMVTGTIYSWKRVGKSTLTGLGAGAAIVGSAFIPAIGPFIAGGLLIGYGIYSDISLEESIEEAKKYKTDEEESLSVTGINLPPDNQISNQANNQIAITPSNKGQDTISSDPSTYKIGSSSSRSYYSSRIESLGWGGSTFESLARSRGVID